MPDFLIVMMILLFLAAWTIQQAAKRAADSSLGQTIVQKAVKKYLG